MQTVAVCVDPTTPTSPAAAAAAHPRYVHPYGTPRYIAVRKEKDERAAAVASSPPTSNKKTPSSSTTTPSPAAPITKQEKRKQKANEKQHRFLDEFGSVVFGDVGEMYHPQEILDALPKHMQTKAKHALHRELRRSRGRLHWHPSGEGVEKKKEEGVEGEQKDMEAEDREEDEEEVENFDQEDDDEEEEDTSFYSSEKKHYYRQLNPSASGGSLVRTVNKHDFEQAKRLFGDHHRFYNEDDALVTATAQSVAASENAEEKKMIEFCESLSSLQSSLELLESLLAVRSEENETFCREIFGECVSHSESIQQKMAAIDNEDQIVSALAELEKFEMLSQCFLER